MNKIKTISTWNESTKMSFQFKNYNHVCHIMNTMPEILFKETTFKGRIGRLFLKNWLKKCKPPSNNFSSKVQLSN